MSLPYSITGSLTGSLISGSFLNEQDTALFTLSQSQDVWYGFSRKDVIELSVFDPVDDSLLKWGVVEQAKVYHTQSLTYLNALNIPQTYTYNELDNTFILYKNNTILVHPIEDLYSLNEVGGSYRLSYVFTRNMAGSQTETLSIKDISPSRTEIKLLPSGQADVEYTAFCLKKFPVRDVAPVLLNVTQKCPYDQIYSVVSKLPEYQNGIKVLKFIFFLSDDGDVLNFLKNLYEDFVQYTLVSNAQAEAGLEPTRITRIQGIKTYFNNYLLTNYDSITDFTELENRFSDFVNVRLNQRFSQFLNQTGKDYTDARQFCYDFFFTYYYGAAVHPLQKSHQLKYFSYLKNFLNFGENTYYSILSTDYLDERVEPTDPLTLVIKLSSALPASYAIKDTCWVSNFGMIPFVFTAILQNPVKYKTIKISPANFGITNQFITKENVNKLYSADDLSTDVETSDAITVNRNLSPLNVDYSNFENFIVFSSADVRLNIFEGKVKSWTELSSSLITLNSRYSSSLTTLAYPHYLIERERIEGQMTEIVDSFDGFESYLFSGGKYVYSVPSASFVSESYLNSMRESASLYDINNRDNLIANTPEYIINDPNNGEYLTFLTMVGQHFDDIYTYISALPIERQLKNTLSSSIPTNTLKEMLISMGWNVDDVISNLKIEDVYLNSLNSQTYDTLSADQRLQIIWNRILINLPGIYKTKGTEDCVRYLMACYGLPSSLISIREYGGVDFTDNSQPTFKLDEKSFMTVYSNVGEYIEGPIPQSVQTVEFKFAVEHPELFSNLSYCPLFVSIPSPYSESSYRAWSIGIKKFPGQFMGKVEFHMESGSTQTVLASDLMPIFNGDIFSVMLRRSDPNIGFEETAIANEIPLQYQLTVQRNENGRAIFYSTSSVNLLDLDNSVFAQYGIFRLGNGSDDSHYAGKLDKLMIWNIPVTDSDFNVHVDDINSYGFSGSNAYKNLWVHLNWDYPQNLWASSSNSSSVWVDNQASYYALPNYYTNGYGSAVDSASYAASQTIIQDRWLTYHPTGSVEILAKNFPLVIDPNWSSSFNTNTCVWDSGSKYPFHFRELIYQQDINASKYGPNKYKNNKIRQVDYSVQARFDADDKSANIDNATISGESNQLGFFVDPQDSKNKDIIRYIGKEGIMEYISTPADLYSDRYYDLINKNYEYVRSGNKRTYFNELLTVYKFYFDKSIFEAIKNILPARANIYTGVVIEPTILERPKYQNKPIVSNISLSDNSSNEGIIANIENLSSTALWVNFNTDWSLLSATEQASLAATMPPNYSDTIDLSYISAPNRVMPDNLSCCLSGYVTDFMDKIQHGYYADFESFLREWDFGGPIPPSMFSSLSGIKGSVSRRDDTRFVIGPDQNGPLRNNPDVGFTGWNSGSHQILYYMLKVWDKYDYFAKTGEYVRSTNLKDNFYNSASVYLYNYILVNEVFMRRLVYFYDGYAYGTGSNLSVDPSTNYSYPEYLHKINTFIGTPDQRVSNIYATNIDVFDPTLFNIARHPRNAYYELAGGYPRNHYTHKMMQFSKTQHSSVDVIYIKGRNSIDSTVNGEGITDGTSPVQSFNTSNVNVVNSSNVIQNGLSGGGFSIGSVVPSGGGTNTGTGANSAGGTLSG